MPQDIRNMTIPNNVPYVVEMISEKDRLIYAAEQIHKVNEVQIPQESPFSSRPILDPNALNRSGSELNQYSGHDSDSNQGSGSDGAGIEVNFNVVSQVNIQTPVDSNHIVKNDLGIVGRLWNEETDDEIEVESACNANSSQYDIGQEKEQEGIVKVQSKSQKKKQKQKLK